MSQIQHSGRISRIEGPTLFIQFSSKSACGSCEARGACHMSEQKEKIVEISVDNPTRYHIGDTVTMGFESRTGLRAVFWAYVMPFLILALTLTISWSIGWNQGLCGLSALGGCGLYFVLLYRFRNYFLNRFSISLID